MRDRVLRLPISENYGCFLMQRSDGGEGSSRKNDIAKTLRNDRSGGPVGPVPGGVACPGRLAPLTRLPSHEARGSALMHLMPDYDSAVAIVVVMEPPAVEDTCIGTWDKGVS
jgi:hypothetical protein